MIIDIIPPGDYPIYKPLPPDKYDPILGEELSRKWELGDGAVMLLIRTPPTLVQRLGGFADPRMMEPVFAPPPERYPNFPGHIELHPGERVLVYRPTPTGKQVFQHTRYEDLT